MVRQLIDSDEYKNRKLRHVQPKRLHTKQGTFERQTKQTHISQPYKRAFAS